MNLQLSDPALQLVPVQSDHLPVLQEIYGSTRTAELERVPHWTAEMKAGFIKQQFEAQHAYYTQNYPGASFWLLRKGPDTIGRLYVAPDFQKKGVRIIDITLLPPWRNQGIGRSIFEDLMKASALLNRPLSIHVESFNPAKRLYERLGFKKISETNGVYHLMEWKPTI